MGCQGDCREEWVRDIEEGRMRVLLVCDTHRSLVEVL